MSQSWTVADMLSQAGKRFYITGGNSGVGYFAAVELARRGAVVVLACRDRAKGEAALKQLQGDAAGPESAAAQAELALLNLASLASVESAAGSELGRGLPLDGLINNAGVFSPPRRLETMDGFELQFGTNVLGHFALTCRLMPALRMANGVGLEAGSRVVTLASISHKRAKIDFDDLQSLKSYKPTQVYAQSKLANLMFAFELERRLRAGMLGGLSIAVHPGVAQTNLFKVGSGKGFGAVVEAAIRTIVGATLNDTRQGALPTLFAATAPQAQGGHYYGPQGFLEMRGGDVGPAFVAKQALDIDAQKRLWEICEELTGVSLNASETVA